ncbi:SpoVR family protein [Planctomycetes bacterium Pan216]|uniref:SpoVR family protein n=1 Tax=Kolteria novifilia TaxID=2527975 RepID=A0A518AZ33_9BACT|nr:SpoVR family protein [Planctomycetes bacterium Pan216]
MVLTLDRSLPADLRDLQVEIEEHALNYGLDFFDVIFELVDHDELNAIAALGGFPNRYPHWRFGMEYEKLSKGYRYGLSKIYELVINNDPCYAYLMDSNALVDQKLVMAHVYGHCDFFKCNQSFSKTNRKMMDEMANHGNRIRSIMDRVGESEVEDFIDVCLSVEDLIDIHLPFIRRRPKPRVEDHEGTPDGSGPVRFDSKDYMESFVNPREALKAEAQRIAEEEKSRYSRFPVEPEKDILLFLLEHAELKPWQREILSIIREEAYYFAPQGQTKIMNEGWASYWHSRIMTERQLTDAEIVDFADHHSGTMAMPPGSFNPYKIGIELFRDIEDRWNKGRFGKEYDECDDLHERRRWDKQLGLGREKIFEVRRIHNDVTFIDTFMTEEFCREHKFFSFAFNRKDGQYEIESREFEQIKDRFLFQLTNHGRPFIYVKDGNFRNRKEMLLRHKFLGVELDVAYGRDVLMNLCKLWGRPVHVATVIEDRPMLMSFDGTEHSTDPIDEESEE